MADEITVSYTLKVTNGNIDETINFPSTTFDQSAVGGPTPGYVTIATTEESQTFGELSTLGWCEMRNLDATNYVQIGFSTGVYGIRLKAGESALFRLEPGVTMYLKANTAAVKMLIRAFEN